MNHLLAMRFSDFLAEGLDKITKVKIWGIYCDENSYRIKRQENIYRKNETSNKNKGFIDINMHKYNIDYIKKI